jgi:hypothetical protein
MAVTSRHEKSRPGSARRAARMRGEAVFVLSRAHLQAIENLG